MALLESFVLESANNPGTGTINLAGAVTGRKTFAQTHATGSQVFYAITGDAGFEEGYGTVTIGSPNTLSRDQVVDNSAGTTAKINFTGAVQVYGTLPARRTLYASQDNTQAVMGGRRASGLLAGTAVDDAPRLDQVAWQTITATTFSTTQSAVIFSLPSGFARYRVEWQGMIPTAYADLYFRASIDGGSTYKAGAADYSTLRTRSQGNSVAVISGTYSYASVTEGTSTAAFGCLEMDRLGTFISDGFVINSTPLLTHAKVSGFVVTSSPLTHLLFGFVSAQCASGSIRLLGARF